jgi:hypothetical protein
MPFVAVGLGLLLLAGATGAVPAMIGGTGALLVAIVVALLNRKDKYDLGTLREVHDREEVRELLIDEPAEYDSFLCQGCGAVYDVRIRTCPRCGRGCG